MKRPSTSAQMKRYSNWCYYQLLAVVIIAIYKPTILYRVIFQYGPGYHTR